MRRFVIVVALAALLPAWACGEDQDRSGVDADASAAPDVQTYVGALENGEARLALVRQGAAFTAYVCGRATTLATHTRWFQAAADGGAVHAVKDGWRLSPGASEHGRLRGELETPEGEVLAWSAALAQAGTEEGLYEANHAGCRAGIIVWKAEQGPSCEAQGSWCDAAGQRGQVTPVACTADDPLRVEGVADGETFELIGERVVLP